MKAKLGNFSPSTLIGTGLVFSSVALVSGGVLSYSARTHQFYASPAQGLPESENGGRLWQATGADGVVIPFSTLTRGLYSGVRQPMQIGIRTQEQWVALWKQHTSIEGNPSPPPHVDFASEMVVGLFLGERSTGGYEVEITRAEQAGSNLRLYYREKSPPRGAIVTQALIQPYHLIKLPKHDLDPVFFREGS